MKLKNIIISSLVFISFIGCSSTEKRIVNEVDILREKDSRLAFISTEYAGNLGVELIIQNKLESSIEIIWKDSKINNDRIILGDTPFEYRDEKVDSEVVVPNITYRRVIFPRKNIKDDNSFSQLSYPVRLEIQFKSRKDEIEDTSIIILNKGKLVEIDVDWMGQPIPKK